MPAFLQIQAVPYARGMRYSYRDLSAVPGVNVLRFIQCPARDALFDSERVMFVCVQHQHRVAAGLFYQLLQRVQLDAVQLMHSTVHVIDRAVCVLEQFVCERGF